MFDKDRWTRATITDRHDWAPGLFSVTLDRSPTFHAGQFTRLGLECGGEPVARAYSIASAPGQPLELFIVTVDGGALTPQLCAMQPGDPVWYDEKILGGFTLEKVHGGGTLWMMGTGTGLAPYLSMLRHGALWSRFDAVVLVHAVRLAAHLAYQDELRRIATQHPLTLISVVSREDAPGALRGRIPALLAEGSLEAAAGRRISPDGHQAMLCGNPGMVKDAFALLKERGMSLHTPRRTGQLHLERYW